MSDTIIRVENIGKRYVLAHQRAGGRSGGYNRLSESLASAVGAPFRRLRNLFGQPPNADDLALREGGTEEEFWALRDVSFEVKRGEVLGIIGRNGAGKSTLLKVLSRIVEPTTGRIEIDGRIAALLEVGTGFHPELTGRENIFLNGAILGMSRVEIRRKFDEIVAFAEVEKFLDTPVKRYSSGMYVRLAFAVAAHLEPEILIVDEVLAVGDAQFQKKCLGKMQSVASEGRTVLFVSHNMALMKTLCESMVWLQQGRVLERGSASELVNRYLQTGAKEASLVTDLSKVARPQGFGTQLRITRIEWFPGFPLFHSEKASIQLNFVVNTDVDAVSLGVGFTSLEGTRLLTYETDDPGERIDVKKGREYSVRVDLDMLPVTPGLYNVDIGARSGDMMGVDYIPNAFRVEVAPGKHTQGHVARGSAGIRFPSNWKWQTVS